MSCDGENTNSIFLRAFSFASRRIPRSFAGVHLFPTKVTSVTKLRKIKIFSKDDNDPDANEGL